MVHKMIKQYQIEETQIIKDPQTLKAIADPLRMNIMKMLIKPKTVKEIASELDTPPTKLYYHINQLEKYNYIRVVETNIVSGIIEKQYLVTAHNYRLDEHLLSHSADADESINALLETVFDVTKQEIRRSLATRTMTPPSESSERTGLIGRSALHLSEEQFKLFHERIQGLIKELDQMSMSNKNQTGDFKPYGFTIAFYPVCETDKTTENE
jgi:DNA-binding transcriptional ArsR family regulator